MAYYESVKLTKRILFMNIKKPQVFKVKHDFRKLLDQMQVFYRAKTQNQLFQYLVLMNMLDIAALKENPNWTKQQRAAWLDCREYAKQLNRDILLVAGKHILKEAEAGNAGTD
jgi:hypothetical protein